MNYRKALKSAGACIRSLGDKLTNEAELHKSIERVQELRINELAKALRLYEEDNREHCELVQDNQRLREGIARLQRQYDDRGEALLAMEAQCTRQDKRANAAESVQELANIKIEQLQGHRIWLAIAIGMFIAKDAALYFGLL